MRIEPHESMQRPKARQRQKQELQNVQGKILSEEFAYKCINSLKRTEEVRTISST